MFIFAYGSNMCTPRLLRRVPSARPVAAAALWGREFRMHKVGADGSAKADAYLAGGADGSAKADAYLAGGGAVLHGVVFEIDEAHKRRLDRAEGLGRGYGETWVDAVTAGGVVYRTQLYVAQPGHLDPRRLPFTWYRDYILAGAREHRLPDAYVAWLAAIPCRPDPVRARALRNRLGPHPLTRR